MPCCLTSCTLIHTEHFKALYPCCLLSLAETQSNWILYSSFKLARTNRITLLSVRNQTSTSPAGFRTRNWNKSELLSPPSVSTFSCLRLQLWHMGCPRVKNTCPNLSGDSIDQNSTLARQRTDSGSGLRMDKMSSCFGNSRTSACCDTHHKL